MGHDNDVERFTHNGRTCRILLDPDPMSPRDYDNVSTLACWHRRAKLGDQQLRMDDYASADDALKALKAKVKAAGDRVLAVLPLYLYEHSGMTMRCGAFSDPFDSGQVGWGYVTKSSAEKMGCVGRKWPKAKLEEAIRAEVACYDNYLTGQIYGYIVEDSDGDELDSCWSIDDLEYCRSEAKSAADSARDPGQVDGACDAACSP